VHYTRSYTTRPGAVTLDSPTDSSNYGVYGRAGWISRISPRDKVAASVEVWQLWQRVAGYSDPASTFNPFDASIATGTGRTNLVKLGGQWTHLFGDSVEANINGGFVQSFASYSGTVATVTGDGTVVPTIGNQNWFEYCGRLGFRLSRGWVRRSVPQRHCEAAAGRQHHPRRHRLARELLSRNALVLNAAPNARASSSPAMIKGDCIAALKLLNHVRGHWARGSLNAHVDCRSRRARRLFWRVSCSRRPGRHFPGAPATRRAIGPHGIGDCQPTG
jgi:hypothetical protein